MDKHGSLDWFEGKSYPETMLFTIKYRGGPVSIFPYNPMNGERPRNPRDGTLESLKAATEAAGK